jgi:hypothetical protein
MINAKRLRRKVAKELIVVTLSLFSLMSSGFLSYAGDMVQVQNLSGDWKFTINEKDGWISTGYNDKEWVTVHVPSPWEDQGFYGYNGFGFYRKSFTVSDKLKDKTLYLILGYIDDVDETFLNGQKIGSTGTFPPGYNTAYNALRVYAIPANLLNFNGINTIAVKVYDSYQAGGIVSGKIGLYTSRYDIPLDINLQGKWKFRTGDDLSRKSWQYDDDNWDNIFVPAKWEDQGYRDYDGYAWYRKSFVYKGEFSDEEVVLILGKIDDVDQVYINGVLVASTGDFSDKPNRPVETGDRYSAFRGYYIPTGVLKKNQTNTIAVRVYDSGGEGGIYQGPVGFVSQPKYIQYWRERKGLTNN